MDSPERNQIGSTSISKIEDSPVFNYINGLSPIKPVKSSHITQGFNPLSFAALPSIFTSPHISSNKESRFRRHNNCSDPSQSALPSDKANEAVELYNNSTERPENFDSGASTSALSIKPPSDHAKPNEELQSLNCYSGSPNSNTSALIQVDHLLEFGDNSDFIFSSSKKHPENGSSEHSKEGMGYDWEGLITDGADMLIFASPDESETMRLIQKPLEPLGDFSPILAIQNDSNNMQIIQIIDPVASCAQLEAEEPSSHHVGACELDEHQGLDFVTYSNSEKCMTNYAGENLVSRVASDSQIYCEPMSNLHRGLRRRCLDFETVGALKKNSGEASSSNSNHASNNKQPLRCKSVGSSLHVLNGIGLHLNAITTSSKRYQDVNHENLSYGRQLSLPSSTALYPSSAAEHEHHLASSVAEREVDLSENEVQMDKDASHPSAYVLDEDINPNSPKKKRRKEQSGESEVCKRCNCKKSKCLKLYCECFAAGVYCIDSCSCQECFNKLIHEDKVLATRKQIETRNSLAFAPKVIRNSDSVPELGDESSKTPASARHKRGCNCKKSSCLKKYCECYQGGVGCSISCRCEGCKNAFGRKDGSLSIELETEQEEEEMEAGVKSMVKKPSLLGTEILNNEEQNLGSLLPSTPLKPCRPMVPVPFSSKMKIGSSFLIPGSSSGLCTGKKVVGKLNILRPPPKYDRQMKSVSEDEMPGILRVDSSSSTVLKTGSPNSKRVSPAQSEFGSSDLPRTGRKLILQSIPSFPSLTPQR